MAVYEQRVVNVLQIDRRSAQDRWRQKGWTVMRVTRGEPVAHRTRRGVEHWPTVDIHLQRRRG